MLVKLSDVRSQKRVYINMDNVISIRPKNDGSELVFVGGTRTAVEESPDEIFVTFYDVPKKKSPVAEDNR